MLILPKTKIAYKLYSLLLGSGLLTITLNTHAADYSTTVSKIKPSIVAIGTHQPLRQPPVTFRGTGFVIGDGTLIVTNAHNIPEFLDPDKKETLVAITQEGTKKALIVTVIAKDDIHDIAILKQSGSPLPSLKLGDSRKVKEGQEYLMTGFPIGGVLGYHPVTHKTMVSAITPAAQPVNNTRQLGPNILRRMRTKFNVFQLDAIAYPGNSGSPVYHPESAEVIGVLNSVFVKETKETILERPSGISYAIPVLHIHNLLNIK